MSLESNFSIGDKVVCIAGRPENFPITGDVYTVDAVEFDESHELWYIGLEEEPVRSVDSRPEAGWGVDRFVLYKGSSE